MENGRDYAKSVSTIIATNVTQRVILFKVILFEENHFTFSTLAHPGYIERKKKKKRRRRQFCSHRVHTYDAITGNITNLIRKMMIPVTIRVTRFFKKIYQKEKEREKKKRNE